MCEEKSVRRRLAWWPNGRGECLKRREKCEKKTGLVAQMRERGV